MSVSSASLGHCLPAGVGNLSAPSAAWPRRSDPSPAHQPLVTQAETLSVGPVARAGEAGPMWPTGGRGPFPILAPLEGRAVPLAQIAARHAGEQTGPYLPGGGQWAHHPSSGIATPASAWLWRVPGALCPGLAATWSRTARRRRVPPLGQRSGDQAPAHRAPVSPRLPQFEIRLSDRPLDFTFPETRSFDERHAGQMPRSHSRNEHNQRGTSRLLL